ncbi:helix-turn-helix domain-containing protein [Paenibacillus sp. FSL H7-0357]|uniref:helix-turn-helix domain-containing protein n=1 Tax=Paenibacillus sp. FSL H7-0357 TaxID=1536774 RepID=UPI0006924BF1|nr:helix-turn-helix domain-containing protein [Paenibacillus sp. FSL H7-0357]
MKMLDYLEETEGLQYICKLIYEAYQIPVCWLDSAGNLQLALPPSMEERPAAPTHAGMLAEIAEFVSGLENNLPRNTGGTSFLPYLHTTGFLENFIMLKLPAELGTGGTIILGPSLAASMTETTVASLMNDHNLPLGHVEEWLQYYRGLPVLSRMRWYHAALLLYSLVNGQALSVTELLLASTHHEPVQHTESRSDLDHSYRRENTWLHHEPMLEREMFRHIVIGDKAGLLRSQASFSEESFGRLSKKSQLRSKKNLAISSITLATRAAIDGGLFWEIAYTLSDFHIQHIEELKDIPAVDKAQLAALCDFADHVRDNRRSKLSRTSALCQNYIFNHMYEELTLSKLAEVAGLNASYLSQLFKKENGISVSDYIQRERIEEAKRLIELPGVTLSDIATRLHFNDQSYFTKVFKKYTGVTPRQFRHDR